MYSKIHEYQTREEKLLDYLAKAKQVTSLFLVAILMLRKLRCNPLLESFFVRCELGHLLSQSKNFFAFWGLAALFLHHLLDKRQKSVTNYSIYKNKGTRVKSTYRQELLALRHLILHKFLAFLHTFLCKFDFFGWWRVLPAGAVEVPVPTTSDDASSLWGSDIVCPTGSSC